MGHGRWWMCSTQVHTHTGKHTQFTLPSPSSCHIKNRNTTSFPFYLLTHTHTHTHTHTTQTQTHTRVHTERCVHTVIHCYCHREDKCMKTVFNADPYPN